MTPDFPAQDDRAERLRGDIAAYRRIPPTEEEIRLAFLPAPPFDDDPTDWEALYPEGEPREEDVRTRTGRDDSLSR